MRPVPPFLAVAISVAASPAAAQQADCPVTHDDLRAALRNSVKPAGGPANGGLENHEWAAVTNASGVICAVAYSGDKLKDQWLGSRAIAAEKATTALALSLPDFALSTANLWAGAQPGGFLFGLEETNPPQADVIYAGKPENFGTAKDPMTGHMSGGTVVFAGGLALYDAEGKLVGGLGASGDTSCADHNVAWRLRETLDFANVPAGPAPSESDAIIYDVRPSSGSVSGYGHPMCRMNSPQIAARIGAGFVPEWKQVTKTK